MNLIKCEKLTKKYPGSEKLALNSVSLSIPAKGIFALIGRNGAGKTTLVRILATQLTPTSGTATVDGFDVMKEPRPIRGMIAVVPQEAKDRGLDKRSAADTDLPVMARLRPWGGERDGEARPPQLGIAKYADEEELVALRWDEEEGARCCCDHVPAGCSFWTSRPQGLTP